VLAACSTTRTAPPASPETASSPESAQPDASPAGTELADTSAIPVAGGLLIDDKMIVITQPTKDEFKAFSSVCPHQGCTVSEFTADKIICPCHDSQFSASTGEVISGPATSGLTAVEITVSGDKIMGGA